MSRDYKTSHVREHLLRRVRLSTHARAAEELSMCLCSSTHQLLRVLRPTCESGSLSRTQALLFVSLYLCIAYSRSSSTRRFVLLRHPLAPAQVIPPDLWLALGTRPALTSFPPLSPALTSHHSSLPPTTHYSLTAHYSLLHHRACM
jgi:hypothetical protein